MNLIAKSTLKVHFVFGGGLSLVFAIGLVYQLLSGERFLPALWNSLTEIRPLELLMIILFWYSAAFQRPQNGWSSGTITTLGLSARE